jgi:hypothetical protein
MFLVLKILLEGLKASFFAMLGLTVSAIVQNKYVVVASPIAFYYILVYISKYILELTGNSTIMHLDIWMVYFTFQFGIDKEVFSFLFSLFYTICSGILFWFIYYRFVGRKMK